MLKIILNLIVINLLYLFVNMNILYSKNLDIDANIIFYFNGGRGVIDRNSQANLYINILDLVENMLLGIDGTYRLIVTDKILENIRNNDFIEIFYREERVVYTNKKNEIKMQSILIPLEGKFTSGKATIFYGNPNYLEFNVCINSKGTDLLGKLRSILR
jgi:hypothetical protein